MQVSSRSRRTAAAVRPARSPEPGADTFRCIDICIGGKKETTVNLLIWTLTGFPSDVSFNSDLPLLDNTF